MHPRIQRALKAEQERQALAARTYAERLAEHPELANVAANAIERTEDSPKTPSRLELITLHILSEAEAALDRLENAGFPDMSLRNVNRKSEGLFPRYRSREEPAWYITCSYRPADNEEDSTSSTLKYYLLADGACLVETETQSHGGMGPIPKTARIIDAQGLARIFEVNPSFAQEFSERLQILGSEK
jgi:hypothetical protein